MKLSEKQTLLKMIKCYKKYKDSFCEYKVDHLYCNICFYNNQRADECKYLLQYNMKNPEEVYIERFGYESLVEEMLCI